MHKFVLDHHQLLIWSYSIDEVFWVVGERFPAAQVAWDHLLSSMDFELIYTPKHFDFPIPPIRDKEDKPILASAVFVQPDLILSVTSTFTLGRSGNTLPSTRRLTFFGIFGNTRWVNKALGDDLSLRLSPSFNDECGCNAI